MSHWLLPQFRTVCSNTFPTRLVCSSALATRLVCINSFATRLVCNNIVFPLIVFGGPVALFLYIFSSAVPGEIAGLGLLVYNLVSLPLSHHYSQGVVSAIIQYICHWLFYNNTFETLSARLQQQFTNLLDNYNAIETQVVCSNAGSLAIMSNCIEGRFVCINVFTIWLVCDHYIKVGLVCNDTVPLRPVCEKCCHSSAFLQ